MNKNWLIVTGDFTRTGGMDRPNYHLAWYLAEQLGHTVHLAAHRVVEPLASHPNVRVHLAPRPMRSCFLGEFALRRLGRRLARQLTAAHPQTRVVVNGGNCAWHDVSWIHIVHHACECRDREAPWWFRLRNRLAFGLDRRRERNVLPHNRLLLANSEKTRRDLIARLGVDPERIEVIYLGVDPEEFGPISPGERAAARTRWLIPEAARVIAFIGALGYDHRKGFDTLLDALGQLQMRGAAVPRVLAAGAGALAYWQKKIDQRQLTDRVSLLGPIGDVKTMLAASDVLVSPTRFDSYGLAIHEALCRGLPASFPQAAGIAERFPPQLQDLLLSDPDDAHELAQRIETWQAHQAAFVGAAADFGSALRAWTWDDMAAAVVGRLEEPRAPARCVATVA